MAGADLEPYPRLDVPPPDDADEAGILRMALLAVAGGAAIGLLGGAFRRALEAATVAFGTVLVWAREEPAPRVAVPLALAGLAAALARWLVRWAPEASGSGVQRVEARMRADMDPAPLRVLPVKFVGGVLAIGVGLALGREGPTVQMGAGIGEALGRRLSTHDRTTLIAAVAGCGLGVAFSAPLGGAVFVFEEVARAVRTRLVATTLLGTASAVAVARPIVGDLPVLPVPTVEPGPPWTLLLYAGLGALLGALAVAYNRLVLGSIDGMSRLRIAPEAKAAIVGALVGCLAVFAPAVVGGGEVLAEEVLLGRFAVAALVGVVLVRWFLGPLSYAIGTPGGLFAPLLALGAAVGALVAGVLNTVAPTLALSSTAFAIVGMAAFFAGVVRAPLTGIVLVVEMTATTSTVVPLLVGSAAAVVVATLLRGRPVYDSLRERIGQPV